MSKEVERRDKSKYDKWHEERILDTPENVARALLSVDADAVRETIEVES